MTDGHGSGIRYERLDVLGRGGQGVVERAWDTLQRRAVALKIRPVPADADRHAILEEARLLLSVPPHPHIALVRADFFEGETHVLVMDFIDGPSLATRLAEAGGNGLPAADVIPWLRDVAAALDHLHGQRPPVIHGDVKPANIVIGGADGDRRAVLVDFGLSAANGSAGRAGATAAYAAPELAHGAPGPASDVYSLGATAYALLTGGPPEPGRPDALSPAARAVVADCLAVRPDARPPSAGVFAERLARALTGTDPATAADTATTGRPSPRQLALGLAASVLLAVLAVSTATRGESPREERAEPAVTTTVVTPTANVPTPVEIRSPSTTASTVAPRPEAGGAPSTVVTSVPAVTQVGRIGFSHGDGSIEVQRIFDSGAMAAQRSGPTGGAGWSALATVRDRIVLAYRQNDGYNRLVTVAPDGALALGRFNPEIGDGWTHVVGLDGGLVFFYRQADGYSSTHRYSDRANLVDQDSYADASLQMVGFDHASPAGANRVLLYSSQTGRSLLLAFGDAGERLEIARPQLTRGWSVLAPTGNGLVAGVATGGEAEVLRPTARGVESLGKSSVGRGTWTDAIAFAHGTIVHNPETAHGYVVRMSGSGLASTTAEFTTTKGARLVRID